MKRYSSFSKLVFALAFIAIIIGFSAFSQKQQKSERDSFRKEGFSKDNDTSTSSQRNRNDTDWKFDRLEQQMKQLDLHMKKLDIEVKKIDMLKVQKEIDEAIKKVDLKKISEQIEKSLENIDWENINKQVEENIKVSKLQMAEVEKEMKQVQANLEKQKAHINLNTGKIKANIAEAMKNAKPSMEATKEELRTMKEFTDALQKDGLIDKSKPFKIEVKNGQLYIDGKKQSKEISEKYRQYYRKRDFTIDMSEGDEFRI